jgi:hypothetical protein
MSEISLASIKMATLQETLINSITYNQLSWFKTKYTYDAILAGFGPIYQKNTLILHCPVLQSTRGVPIYKDGAWKQLEDSELVPGTRIRIAVKINGISFLQKSNYAAPVTNLLADNPLVEESQWSGKSRIQHRILGIIVQSAA